MLYRIVRFLVTGFARTIFRVRLEGLHNVPVQGACILAPSHRSMWDIPLLACATSRRIRYMGKREAFEWPVIGKLFHTLGSFPVERDGDDRAALRAALSVLTDDGEPLAVYPEGTRQRGAKIAPLQPGAAYMAIRAGVPLVPIGVAGTEEINHREDGSERRLLRPGKVALVVGEPILPPDREGRAVKRASVDALSGQLRADLQATFDRAYELRSR